MGTLVMLCLWLALSPPSLTALSLTPMFVPLTLEVFFGISIFFSFWAELVLPSQLLFWVAAQSLIAQLDPIACMNVDFPLSSQFYCAGAQCSDALLANAERIIR